MKLNRVIGALALGAALLGGSFVVSEPASATDITKYVDGGKWHYGVKEPSSQFIVFSDYFHPKTVHRSTACGTKGCVRSRNANPGKWSEASVTTTVSLFGKVNEAYYYNY